MTGGGEVWGERRESEETRKRRSGGNGVLPVLAEALFTLGQRCPRAEERAFWAFQTGFELLGSDGLGGRSGARHEEEAI